MQGHCKIRKRSIFSEKLQEKFPWFRRVNDETMAECKVCGNSTVVSVASDATCNLLQHMGSRRHRHALLKYRSPLKRTEGFIELHKRALLKDKIRWKKRKSKTKTPVLLPIVQISPNEVTDTGITPDENITLPKSIVKSVQKSSKNTEFPLDSSYRRRKSSTNTKCLMDNENYTTPSNQVEQSKVKLKKPEKPHCKNVGKSHNSKIQEGKHEKHGMIIKGTPSSSSVILSDAASDIKSLKSVKTEFIIPTTNLSEDDISDSADEESTPALSNNAQQSYLLVNSECVAVTQLNLEPYKSNHNSSDVHTKMEDCQRNLGAENTTLVDDDVDIDSGDDDVEMDTGNEMDTGESIHMGIRMCNKNEENPVTYPSKESQPNEDDREVFCNNERLTSTAKFAEETDQTDLALDAEHSSVTSTFGSTCFKRASSKNGRIESKKTHYCKPIIYFRKFFHRDLLLRIVNQSNLYCTRTRLCKSLKLTFHELEQWLAILIYTSVIRLGDIKNYWNKLYGLSFVYQNMSEERWSEIQIHLSFSNNKLKTPQDNDKKESLNQMRSLMTALRAQFEMIPMPRSICIIRDCVVGKETSSLLGKSEDQYQYALLVDKDGMIYSFFPNFDKIFNTSDGCPDKSFDDIVLMLAQAIPDHKNHCLLLDDLLINGSLIQKLGLRGIFCLGTAPHSEMKGLDTSSHNTVENTQKVKYIAYECILNNSIFVHLIKDSDRSDSVFCRSYPSRKNVKSYDTIHKYAKHLKYVKKIVSDYFSSIEYFSSTNSQQIFFQSVMFALQNAWLLYVRDHEDVTEFNNAVSNINDFRCSVAHSLMYADASHLQE